MPTAKTIELRDRMTFIPMIAIKVDGNDGYLERRAGYGRGLPMVLFGRLDGTGPLRYDPYEWHGIGDRRTYHIAHLYVAAHFDELDNGAVVDVEFILAETTEPKTSERATFE